MLKQKLEEYILKDYYNPEIPKEWLDARKKQRSIEALIEENRLSQLISEGRRLKGVNRTLLRKLTRKNKTNNDFQQ